MLRSRMFRRWTAAVAVLALVAAGCGDDDDESTGDDAGQEAAAGGDVEAYCAIAAELDSQEEFPSAEQLAALAEAAPEAIKADVEFVVERFTAAIEAGDPASAFADPEVEEHFEPIEEFETTECGLGDDEDEGAEQDPSVTELDPSATQVAVSATEYDFTFSAPGAGRTSFVMTNDGEEAHLMDLAKLVEGATLEEALQADDASELIAEEYESDIAAAGEEAVLTVELTEGDWALVCYLPAPDGEPHLLKGMAVPFTVG